jgi:hypothetical protein
MVNKEEDAHASSSLSLFLFFHEKCVRNHNKFVSLQQNNQIIKENDKTNETMDVGRHPVLRHWSVGVVFD